MIADPLTEALYLLRVRSVAVARLEVGGRWSYRFPAKPHLKFHSLLRGGCWIILPDQEPCRLRAGDTFLLANAPSFVLSHDLAQPPDDAVAVFGTGLSIYSCGGDETIIVGGGFDFDSEDARFLLATLPSFLLVRADMPGARVMDTTLRLLNDELAAEGPGSALMIRRLADVLVLQALRAVMEERPPESLGWIGALNDRRIGPALARMHADVGHPWSVAELARSASMSRASFAARFKAITGLAPLAYLTWWRM